MELAMWMSLRARAARGIATVLLAAHCWLVQSVPLLAQEQTPSTRILSMSWYKDTDLDAGKLFDAVVETIDRHFFDETLLKERDWRTRAAAIRSSVIAATTADEAVHRINELLAELKTSHTGLFTPDDYEYYLLADVLGSGRELSEWMSHRFWGSGPYYPGIGAFTRAIEGRHFVDGVLEGSPADRAGLRYGDEIISVDGEPYSAVAAFRGKIGSTCTLVMRRAADSEPQSIAVPVVPIRPAAAFSAATMASARIIERGGRRIGYIHVWASRESETFRAALTKLSTPDPARDRLRVWGIGPSATAVAETARRLDGLIVDMRGRIGGNIGVAERLLELLDAKNAAYWGNVRTIVRMNSGLQPRASTPTQPFRGRSAVLIDQRTRSAAEYMAYGYRRSGFGPLVGTTTAGAVTSGALFPMPGDLLLYVAVAGHVLNGQPLEGLGVAPDVRVERPLAYAAGADPVLEAALDLLASEARK
ncbi:MAG: PDZ domain-containing protein [Hyphomicrobiales bacterium]|nr:PDZ domain-containing protein [Hyphomicrobiales bacterium]